MPNKLLASDVTIAVETYDQIIDDLKPLLTEHWRELALYQDEIPLDPDYDGYKRICDAGVTMVTSVRVAGALVGYAVYVLQPHMHYRGHRWAVSDLFWLHPDHRSMGLGNALFAFIEDALRERGVDVMHTTFKKHFPAAGMLLESRGHAMVELGYSKRLRQ